MQFQFTLRSMLVAVLLLSWPIARISNEFRKERLRAEAQQVAMSKLNGLTPKGISMSVRDATFVLPAPLRQLIGSWCIDDQRVLVTMFPVTEIDLSSTSTSDEQLAVLAKLSGLEVLDLSGTRITNAGLIQLVGLTKLKKLSLKGTTVTDEGIGQLRRKLPTVTIDF